MAFSALEALQAFGAGRQMAQQDRTQNRAEETYQRQERERQDFTKAINPATGEIDRGAARNAFLGAGDPEGAIAFDRHMTEQHGLEFTQNRDRLIAGAQFLSGVHDEAGFQDAVRQAHAAGIDLANVPPHFDPQWVQNIIRIGTHLQAAQHYQPPSSVQQELESAGIRPGTPEYRSAIMSHVSTPRILMVDGQPTLVSGDAGGGAGGAPENLPHVATQEEAARLAPGSQFIGPDNQVHTVPGGPAPAPGNFP